ncbi:MAG: hypothetical protein ACHQ1G_01400 [Planctomycetota bacterium]
MTRSFAILLCAALAACTSSAPSKKTEAPNELGPSFQRAKALYEVLDEKTEARVGFVEKTTYDDGRVIYWVTGPDRDVKYGYMLPNNNGYKYDWVAGVRSQEAESIGADTFHSNARRILGYKSPVKLHEIAWKDLLKEYEAPPADAGGKKA